MRHSGQGNKKVTTFAVTRRPVSLALMKEGAVCDYIFSSDVPGELDGLHPLVILGDAPAERMIRRLDVQGVPISSLPNLDGEKNIALTSRWIGGTAVLDLVTTFNPAKFFNYRGQLSKHEVNVIKNGLVSRFETATELPRGKAAHLRQRHIVIIPTDSAPQGRRYVLLNNRRGRLDLDRLQFLPVPDNIDPANPNVRIRSFSVPRVADMRPDGKLEERSFEALRALAGRRLVLPAFQAQQPPA